MLSKKKKVFDKSKHITLGRCLFFSSFYHIHHFMHSHGNLRRICLILNVCVCLCTLSIGDNDGVNLFKSWNRCRSKMNGYLKTDFRLHFFSFSPLSYRKERDVKEISWWGPHNIEMSIVNVNRFDLSFNSIDNRIGAKARLRNSILPSIMYTHSRRQHARICHILFQHTWSGGTHTTEQRKKGYSSKLRN